MKKSRLESCGVDMAKSSVNRAIRIYATYCVKLDIKEPHAIQEITDYTKLDMMRGVVTSENIIDLLEKAKTLPRNELYKEIQKYKDGKGEDEEESDCVHARYQKICKKCGEIFD